MASDPSRSRLERRGEKLQAPHVNDHPEGLLARVECRLALFEPGLHVCFGDRAAKGQLESELVGSILYMLPPYPALQIYRQPGMQRLRGRRLKIAD
jgi:hypothetical protein